MARLRACRDSPSNGEVSMDPNGPAIGRIFKPEGPTLKSDITREVMRYAWHAKSQLQAQGFAASWTADPHTGRRCVVSVNDEAAKLTLDHVRTLKDEDGNLRFVRTTEKDLVHKDTIAAHLRNG